MHFQWREPMTTEPSDDGPDTAVENVSDEFVELFNARDLDTIAELVTSEVTSDLFDGSGVDSAVHGLAGLLRRYPQLIATRGEDGNRPIVALWVPDEQERYRLMGYLEFGTDEELIDRISYVDTPGSDLLVEEPDEDELAEWQDWREWDSGEEAIGRQGAD
jgi:hypothetical protein